MLEKKETIQLRDRPEPAPTGKGDGISSLSGMSRDGRPGKTAERCSREDVA